MIEYDRIAAVEYAKRWALLRNEEFYDYESIGGDCTNFASQCVYAGCGVMNYNRQNGWYYIDANDKSPSWTGVNYFYQFMTTNTDTGPFGEYRPINRLIPGDIIQLGDENNNFYHTLVLTGKYRFFGRTVYLICAHSIDAYQRDLSTYNYKNIRGIHIIGANE